MKFRLLDKSSKDKVHEGVAILLQAPPVISWGNRAFILRKADEDTAVYVEVDCFRIGALR